jgi:YjbE family integral membrane protein
MLVGICAAIGLRIYLTAIVSYVLDIPSLKLIGGLALVIIAVKLTVDEDKLVIKGAPNAPRENRAHDMLSAIVFIVIADLSMSLDNVVALAAVSQGSILYLGIGLLLSIPLLMYGSLLVAAVMKRYPIVVCCGGVLLGWIAGDIAMSDRLISAWIDTQAPALPVAMPLLVALFVLLESRIVERDHRTKNAESLANRTADAPIRK